MLGGNRGLTLRLRVTAAYSVTSIAAIIGLYFLLVPLVEVSNEQMTGIFKVLVAVLSFDLVVQTIYNESALRSIITFFRSRESGELDPAIVRQATADFLALPRHVSVVCLALWMFTVLVLCTYLRIAWDMAWLKLAYVFATTSVTAFIAFVFQYSLFRRVIAPTGALLLQYGEGLESLRESFHVSARFRLMVTFMLLVLGALSLSGLMAYGQYIKLTGEQAGVLAAAGLNNAAADLSSDPGEWPAFVAERERIEQFQLAVWERESNRLVGSLPIPLEHIRERIGSTSGSFEEPRSMSRVTYRNKEGVTLIAVMTPKMFLSGGMIIIWVTLLIVLVSFGFTAFVFNLVTRDIVRPFQTLRRFTKNLAQGRLEEAPVIVTEDELGRLGSALRLMDDGLRTMFTDLRGALDGVKVTRNNLAGNLREIQARSADQDRNVDRSFMSFNELNQALRDISDNVLVVEKATRESKDAAHDMGRYLDDIRAELAELVDTVRGGSRFIFSMIENVEQSTLGVTTLRDNVERLQDQIRSIANAFSQLAEEMQRVLRDSATAAETSNHAIAATDQTASGVTLVREATEELLGQLQRFREGILKIAGVVAVISDVTEQTALLAFNAAILAAQSQDEHAKDFAVVGDEIKDLAERTESSTKDVGHRMKAINEHADRSLDEMREALGLIQQGQLLTVLAADSVRLIGDHSGRYDRDARAIGEGIYYQNHNLSQILAAVAEELKRVDNLRGFTDDNGKDAALLRSALDELLDFVRKLQVSSTEQNDGARHILRVVDQIGDGISRMRRDLRKLSNGSGEIVQLMNDVRMTSRRNTEQTDEMSHQLKKLDHLLRGVEAKLASLSLS